MARRQQMADRALRPAMRSPGRPIPARHVEREFWRLIAQGMSTEDAAVAVGVSVPVGSRWFRHAGGMTPLPLAGHLGPVSVVRGARGVVAAASPGSRGACDRP